jgi:Zn-dependent peptidase ImmA (M78 family)
VIKILAKIKRIHGFLAYKSKELKEEFQRQQLNDLMLYMTECEEMASELLLDEEVFKKLFIYRGASKKMGHF